MKKILALIILSLSIQFTFGQACGVYRIKYVGEVKSESFKIEKIKLPTIRFLHGFGDKNSDESFTEIEIKNHSFSIELRSHITSHLYEKSENLLKLYKTKRENILIIITINENGTKREIKKVLSWKNIQIKKLEDEKFGTLFELNLNEIIEVINQ